MNEAERKTAIREAMRQRRRMLSEEDIREAEAVLSEQFIATRDKDLKRVISDAQVIALYKSVHNELPCDGIAEFFTSNGRTVCYPRVKGDDMDFYEITDPSTQFTEGAYGIPEPRNGCRKIYKGDIDLMIVPAVAYNEEGLRLGQGGGYYDRWFSACEKEGKKMPFTVGVCYDFQIYSALPVESHDHRVDCVMCVFTGE